MEKIITGIIGIAVAGVALAGCNGGSVEKTSKLPDTYLKIDGAKVYYSLPASWSEIEKTEKEVRLSTGIGVNEVHISYSDEDYMGYDKWIDALTTDDYDEFITAPVVESVTIGDVKSTFISLNYDMKDDKYGEMRELSYLVPMQDNTTLMISLYEEADTKTVEADFKKLAEDITIIKTE